MSIVMTTTEPELMRICGVVRGVVLPLTYRSPSACMTTEPFVRTLLLRSVIARPATPTYKYVPSLDTQSSVTSTMPEDIHGLVTAVPHPLELVRVTTEPPSRMEMSWPYRD